MSTLEHFLRARSDRCTGCGNHVGTQGCRCAGSEWTLFVAALRQSVRVDGTIHQCDVRPLVRGKVAPKRISRFWQVAQQQRLISRSGNFEDSDDVRGKNAHRVEPIYVWDAAA